MKTFTYWKGVYDDQQLRDYLDKTGELPECEMFKTKMKGDDKLISKYGYIAKENSDTEIARKIPKTLRKALNINL